VVAYYEDKVKCEVQIMIQTPTMLSAQTILGTAVVNDAGEDLGKIEDLDLGLE